MIQITPHMRILVAIEPGDFRAGIDALVGICRQRLASDPFGGGLLLVPEQFLSYYFYILTFPL